ncbi:cytotoxic T-lymphocyte protein 4 [Hemicordylus capensis]|uniref:cytotoxic T-lymphocyte protein 4 n=1 Tax=Hemicordylus capensis TaxID=884348 RepID=UPI002303E911|nr:cytotoxic T-lymphocyte protein 4 [Hemicordylus capensis]
MISLFLSIVFCSIAVGITKVIEVTQPALIIAKREGPAHFMCEYKYAEDAEELRITLMKERGNQSINICASFFTFGYGPFVKKNHLQCQVHPSHNNVNFTLWGVQSSDAGRYVCKFERIYPPPYYQVVGRGSQLYVTDPEPCLQTHVGDRYPYLWIVVVVASALLAYSILITIYLLRKTIQKRRYFAPGLYVKMAPM